ncbi:MAG: MFS transporter, partial [Thermoplasmata archaeon]
IMGGADSLANLLKVFVGWYSDRVSRRKPFVAFGYAPVAFVRPLLAFATSWWHVLGIRLADRAGKGIRTAPRDALIIDSVGTDRRGAAFGLHRAMDTAGAIIGTAIAILLVAIGLGTDQTDDMRMLFLLSAIPAVISVLIVIFFVRERAERTGQEGSKATLGFVSSLRAVDPKLKRFLVVVVFIGLANVGYTFFVLRAHDFGAGLMEVLVAYLLMNITYTLFSYPSGSVSDRVGRKKMLMLGMLVFVAASMTIALSDSLVMVFLGFLIYGTFLAIVDVNQGAFASMLSRTTDRGTVMGAFHTVSGLTALPAGVIFGLIWSNVGMIFAFGYASVIAIFAFFLLWWFVRESEELRTSTT